MRDRRIWEISSGPSSPRGHFTVSVTNVAVGLPSLPEDVRRMVLRSMAAPINWRDDGTDPTLSSGMPVLTDEPLIYDGDVMSTFKMIRSTGVDADVRVAYYA